MHKLEMIFECKHLIINSFWLFCSIWNAREFGASKLLSLIINQRWDWNSQYFWVSSLSIAMICAKSSSNLFRYHKLISIMASCTIPPFATVYNSFFRLLLIIIANYSWFFIDILELKHVAVITHLWKCKQTVLHAWVCVYFNDTNPMMIISGEIWKYAKKGRGVEAQIFNFNVKSDFKVKPCSMNST